MVVLQGFCKVIGDEFDFNGGRIKVVFVKKQRKYQRELIILFLVFVYWELIIFSFCMIIVGVGVCLVFIFGCKFKF